MKHATKFIWLSLLASQTALSQFAEPWLHMGTDGRGYHLFHLNPAALPTTKSKADAVIGRHTKQNTMDQTSGTPTTFSNETTESLVGIAAMGDLGAGASAGLSYTKLNKTSNSKSTGATLTPEETMETQTFSGRMVIELIPGLNMALTMRYLFEKADMQGSFNVNRNQRIEYKGTLVGYATGIKYATKEFFVGGAYYPPSRGKAEIISEDKLITEPGLTMLEAAYERDKVTVGASYLRWIHRRDERAPTTTSEDGQRQLSITGLDFDRFLFPVTAMLLGADYKFDQKVGARFSFARHADVFEFDPESNPSDSSDTNRVDYNKIKGALRILAGQVDIQIGFGTYTRSYTLSGTGQAAGNYSASGKEIFAEIHSEF